MPILEIKNKQVVTLSKDNLNDFLVQEQKSIRAILRDCISTISPNMMVITENFKDTKNGIDQVDLLCLDRDLNLVVIEFLSPNGNSGNLSSIKNSALISKISFEEIVKSHQDFLNKSGAEKIDAQEEILKFLGKSYLAVKAGLPKSVRIILVSKEIQTEIEATATWLKNNGINIGWVRIKRFQIDERVWIEVDQIISLEESEVEAKEANKILPPKKTSPEKKSQEKSNVANEKTTPPKKEEQATTKSAQKAKQSSSSTEKDETVTKSTSQKSTTKKEAGSKSKESKLSATSQSKDEDPRYYDLSIQGKTMSSLPKRRVIFRALRYLFATGTTPDAFFKKCKNDLPPNFMVKIKGDHDAETFIGLAQKLKEKEGGRYDTKRFFCKDNELIKKSGFTYSIGNQWKTDRFNLVMKKIISTYKEHNIQYSPSD